MNKLKLPPPSFWKWFVAALAAGNLIFLFVFNYQLPGFLRPSADSSEVSEEASDGDSVSVSSNESVAALQIQVPDEALVYDGTKQFDLMDGVSVLDASGTVQPDVKVFSTIKAGSSRKEKIIEYSVTDSDGNRVTAERQLSLGNNYSGPSIEIYGDMPDLSADNLPVLVSLLINDNLIYADDGFGSDITSAVVSSVKSNADESGNTVVTLTVTNMVNDSYSTDVVVHTGTVSGPVLKLLTDSTILSIGEEFNFYKYLDYAHDEEGNDISNRIRVEGTVDTSKPGQYQLKCYCSDSKGNISPTVILTVTVR